MNSLGRKVGQSKSRGVKAPSYDPYNRFSNTGNGMFGFRQDKNVVIPGVTRYESQRLKGVKNHVEKVTGKPCTLSDELIEDMYSIYVNEDIKRRPETKNNSVRHKVLDKVYDSLTKIVTVDSPLFTQMLTRELAVVLQKVDDEIKENGGEGSGDGLESEIPGEGGSGGGQDSQDDQSDSQEQDQSQSQDGGGDGNGGQGDSKDDPSQDPGNSESKGSGGGTSDRSPLEKMIDQKLEDASKSIEKAKEAAGDKIKDLESQLGKEAMKDLMNSDPEFLENIDALKDKLSKISVSKDSIQKVLEKILNESQNYFSKKFKRVEESLFDCEECEDLFGIEFLHDVFGPAGLLDIGNETRVYKGKLDLYLDCSGSMNSSKIFEGTSIRMSDLAKGIAMVMHRMGMIENLYFFNTGLYEIKNVNEISILSFSKSGGTCFDTVIKKVKENGNNSVIVTDGQDSCNHYSKQAFFIGIGGTKFNRSNDSFRDYRAAKQCVAYNPETSKLDYV